MRLLINNIHKKNYMVKQKKRTRITQSGKLHHKLSHLGSALDMKAKDLIGSDETYCLSANHNPEFLCILHWYYTFCTAVLHLNCTALSQ